MNPTGNLQQQEVNISDYIKILLRRRNVIMTGFLSVFILAVLYTFLMKPVYEASSSLYVKDDKSKIDEMSNMLMMGKSASIAAEIEIVKSRTIAEEVVRKFHMDWAIEPSSSTASCRFLTLQSTRPWSKDDPSYTLTMTGVDSFVVMDSDDKLLGSGRSGIPFQHSGLSFQVQLYGTKGESFTLKKLNFNRAVEALQKGCNATEAVKMSNVIKITYQNTDPLLARDVVNGVVQEYLNRSLLFKTQEASRSVNFIEIQLQGVKDDLQRAETKLQEYKSSTGVVQLDAEAQELIKNYSDLEKDRFGINLQKKQLDFALTSQKESLAQGSSYSPAVMKDDPLVAQMAASLAQLEVQKKSLLVTYTKNHPAVESVQSQIDELQRKIRATYETGARNLSAQELNVNGRLGKLEERLKMLPVKERDLARYTRLAKVSADIYTFLLQKHEQARIQKASTITNINVIDTAITPDIAVKPKKSQYLLIGLVMSLIAGVGLAFFMENLDDSIKDETEAKQLLKLTHLSTIPHLGNDDKEKVFDKESLAFVTHTDTRSMVAESFRALRTAIHFSSVAKHKKVIMLTSSFPGEGKSTISSNLAITIAQTGVRTLFVDCDMHKPKQYKWLNIPRSPGLSEVLSSGTDLAMALHETYIPNLSFLPAGNTPPNPSILLGSQDMLDLIERLKGMYDQIVIDLPPILPVPDTALLTVMADVVVIVLESTRVPSASANRTRDLLREANAPVAGFVFNNKSLRGIAYGYGKYGYGYGYGYGEEHNKKKKRWYLSPMVENLLTKISQIKFFKS